MTDSDSVNLTAIMKAEGIRDIAMLPSYIGGFRVTLNCGGTPGYGETVGEALADAMAKNADYLHLRRLAA